MAKGKPVSNYASNILTNNKNLQPMREIKYISKNCPNNNCFDFIPAWTKKKIYEDYPVLNINKLFQFTNEFKQETDTIYDISSQRGKGS